MKEKIAIGEIVKSIGLKGELKVMPLTNDLNRFKKLTNFFIGGFSTEFDCQYAKIRPNYICLKIKGFDSVNEVEKFKSKMIYVSKEDAVILKKDEYFISDLIGCRVIDGEENVIGEITDIENFGASDIIVIASKNAEIRLPFLEDVFSRIDTENKRVQTGKRFDEVCV